MFAVVLALAAAETRFFVPAGPLPAQQVAAPGQFLAPAEFGQAPAAYADYAPVYADYAPVYSATTQGAAALGRADGRDAHPEGPLGWPRGGGRGEPLAVGARLGRLPRQESRLLLRHERAALQG